MDCVSAEAVVLDVGARQALAFLLHSVGATSLSVEHGRFNHTALVARLAAFTTALASSAIFSFLALGCDGASTDLKLLAYILEITETVEGRLFAEDASA